MTDEPESTEEEVEEEFEWEADAQPYPDMLQAGMVFFYPDLGAFCEEHGAKAVQVAEDGGIWLFPAIGGKPVSLDSIAPEKPPSRLHSIKPADGTH